MSTSALPAATDAHGGSYLFLRGAESPPQPRGSLRRSASSHVHSIAHAYALNKRFQDMHVQRVRQGRLVREHEEHAARLRSGLIRREIRRGGASREAGRLLASRASRQAHSAHALRELDLLQEGRGELAPPVFLSTTVTERVLE